jgi:hypothetical protein
MLVDNINNTNLINYSYVKVSFLKMKYTPFWILALKLALSEEIYNKVTAQGLEMLDVPLQSCVLISAFGNRTRRLTKQAMFAVSTDNNVFE